MGRRLIVSIERLPAHCDAQTIRLTCLACQPCEVALRLIHSQALVPRNNTMPMIASQNSPLITNPRTDSTSHTISRNIRKFTMF